MDPSLIPARDSSKRWQEHPVPLPSSRAVHRPASSASEAAAAPPPYSGHATTPAVLFSQQQSAFQPYHSLADPRLTRFEVDRLPSLAYQITPNYNFAPAPTRPTDLSDPTRLEGLRNWKSGTTTTKPDQGQNTLKRKASVADLEESKRAGPPPPYPGSSTSNAIDLSSPPTYSSMNPPHRRPHRQSSQSHRPSVSRPSAIILPNWQTDGDVTRCPCCSTEFSILTRRHHCRKCGRVVCDACSRHRITIPSKYIVRPPDATSTSTLPQLFSASPTQPQTGAGTARQSQDSPNLSGSETVRVCKPCVPDPNLSPPPQLPNSLPHFSPPPLPPPHSSQRHSSRSESHASTPAAGPRPGHASSTMPPPPSLMARGPPPIPQRSRYSGSHVPTDTPSSPYRFGNIPENSSQQQRTAHQSRRATTTSSSQPQHPHLPHPYHGANPYQPTPDNPYGHRHHSSVSHHHRRPIPPSNAEAPSSSTSVFGPPQREIAEEDECPVCGRELPPKGPNDDEAPRVKHVENCILLYSSTPTSGTPSGLPPPPSSTSNQHRNNNAPPAISSSAPTSGIPFGSPNINRPPSTSTSTSTPRPTRMIRYRATEKDCVSASGEQQECVICMEDFAVGEEMGRLDCFCCFHAACIREWWGRRAGAVGGSGAAGTGAGVGPGQGSCPTHQVS